MFHLKNLKTNNKHVPCTGAAGEAGNANAPPIVVMQMEPEKRLSHKEVEQRRREKAKQVNICVHYACVGTWMHKCVNKCTIHL